jgi:hypothetical protein
VTATNVETQISRTVQTNETGTYLLANLQPGSYRCDDRQGGLPKSASNLVTLNVNQIATPDVRLAVRAVSESVRISAGATALEQISTD